MVHMEYYLVVSTFMMFAGIYGFFTRRNLLAMLISVELILNSVDINFAVFNRYLFPNELEGVFFALFAIGVSAAETAVAIAIIINIYRNIRNIQVKNLNEMKIDYGIYYSNPHPSFPQFSDTGTGRYAHEEQRGRCHRHSFTDRSGIAFLPHRLSLFHRRPYGSRHLPPPSCPTTLNGCRSQPTFISIWAFCSILFPS